MKAKSLAQNTFFLTASSALQKVIAFVYYSFLAKGIGPTQTGKYNFALIFTGVFVLLMDFGLGPVLTREGARHEENIQQTFQRVLGLKIILIGISWLLLFLVTSLGLTQFKNIDNVDLLLIGLAAMVIVLDTLTFTFFSTFRAFRNLSVESVSILVYQLIIFVGGYIVVSQHWPTPFLVGALMVGSFSNMLFAGILLKCKTRLSFKPIFEWSSFRHLLKLAFPFALAGVFFKLSGSIDGILLKVLSEDRFVGWYSLAYKLSFALTVLPGSFASSFFPVAAAAFESHREQLGHLFEKATLYIMALSIPIAVGIFYLADDIILSVYGPAWEASIDPLRILGASLIFTFWNYPVGNLLNAVNKQALNTTNMGIALLVNITLNVLLIPRFTFIGAALAAGVSSVVLVGLGLPHVKRLTSFSWVPIGKNLFGVVAAASSMGGILILLESLVPWYLLVLISVFVYFSLLLAIGVISLGEIKPMVQRIWKK